MDLKEAEITVCQFAHLKNKKIFFENSKFIVNEISVQLSGEPNNIWKPIMICSEIDNNNCKKNILCPPVIEILNSPLSART